jgi:hypothetical protein
MLEALRSTLGIVSPALIKANVSRFAYYDWLKSDEDFRKEVDQVAELALDFAESKLHKLIKDEIPSAVFFYLKTKGKGRGYIERQEIEQKSDTKIEYVNVSKQHPKG